jgi:tight adherence protein B
VKLRLVAILIALAGVVGALASTAAATPTFHITEAGAVFPDRAYVLSLPTGMRLNTSDVSVEENGQGISGLSVVPAGGAKAKDFGVVLVIDTSISMRGKPLDNALAATRAFVAQRKASQQVGIVTFNGSANVLLPLTTDQLEIDKALARRPALNVGTHIYDAVRAAISMLQTKGIDAGSIVVLSDGADTGSTATAEGVTSAARLAHVRVFTVGLRSRFFEKAPLVQLAGEGRGRYVEARSAKDLTGIYKSLGSELASEYLVRYRSLAGPGKKITVRVSVEGIPGVAGSAYETPRLNLVHAPKGPYHPSLGTRLWQSAGTMLVIALLSAALIGLGVTSLTSGPKQGTLRRRMAEFVSVPSVIEARQRPTAQLTEKMLAGTESLLKGNSRWERFKWELRVAGIALPAEQIAVLTVLGTIVMLVVVRFITGSLLFAIAFAAVVPYATRWWIKRSLARCRQHFAEQLPDNLQVLSSALRAGHSFVGALSVVVNDAPEPARTEFSRVVADEQLGVPIEDALRVVAERMDNRELEQVALVAALQRETGGNTAEVLDRVTDTIRERFELRRTVLTLTAQGRMSRWVLTLLPVALFFVIKLINPGYIDIMTSTTAGKILMVFAGITVSAGSLAIKRIVDIKV